MFIVSRSPNNWVGTCGKKKCNINNLIDSARNLHNYSSLIYKFRIGTLYYFTNIKQEKKVVFFVIQFVQLRLLVIKFYVTVFGSNLYLYYFEFLYGKCL